MEKFGKTAIRTLSTITDNPQSNKGDRILLPVKGFIFQTKKVFSLMLRLVGWCGVMCFAKIDFFFFRERPRGFSREHIVLIWSSDASEEHSLIINYRFLMILTCQRYTCLVLYICFHRHKGPSDDYSKHC